MPVRVVSKRVGGTKPVAGEWVISIARGSILGNPFVMYRESERAEVIAKYKAWLEQQYHNSSAIHKKLHWLADQVHAGTPIALECWCAPCACHGDVVIEAIEAINKRR